jgi:hypothetical protein
MALQPAYKTTRVDSMRWNCTYVNVEMLEQPASGIDCNRRTTAEVLAQPKAATESQQAVVRRGAAAE